MRKFNNQIDINPLEGYASFIIVAFIVLSVYTLGVIVIVAIFSGHGKESGEISYPYNWYQYYIIALLVAPLGALIRWKLGAIYNGKIWFPFGTFIGNVLAVPIDAISVGAFLAEFGPGPLDYYKPTNEILSRIKPISKYFYHDVLRRSANCFNMGI